MNLTSTDSRLILHITLIWTRHEHFQGNQFHWADNNYSVTSAQGKNFKKLSRGKNKSPFESSSVIKIINHSVTPSISNTAVIISNNKIQDQSRCVATSPYFMILSHTIGANPTNDSKWRKGLLNKPIGLIEKDQLYCSEGISRESIKVVAGDHDLTRLGPAEKQYFPTL